MQIIPAVDIKDGRCVRLKQGRKSDVTVFSEDPIEMAQKWQDLGAKILHVVDLDGAFDGEAKNLDIVQKLIKSINIPIEFGGGVRDRAAVEALLDMGVHEVVLGTKAYQDRGFLEDLVGDLAGRVIIGIDAHNGFVAVKGWTEVTETTAVAFARDVEKMGFRKIIFTDISRDGMMAGPNLESLKTMISSVTLQVVASGGISSLDDIKAVINLGGNNLCGVILGKSIYTGAIQLQEAIKIVESMEGGGAGS